MARYVTVTLTLPDGKRKYFRGATRKEAEKKRDEAKRLLDAGIDLTTDPTVEEYAKLWLAEYKEGVVRDTTYMNLRSHINAHIIPSLGRMKMRAVKPVHIRRMLGDMDGLSKGTQSVVLSVARELFKTAMENDVVTKNPCVSTIRPRGEDTKEKDPLTPEQEELLLEKARGTSMYMFVLLGLNAGLRRGELLGLQWSDFDFTEGTVTVRRSVASTREHVNGELCYTLKTDAAYRVIPLPWPVIDEVRSAMRGSDSVYVVPGPSRSFLGLSSCKSRWSALMKGLNFEATPHRMRHTRVTRWFEQGLDIKEVQYLAGHSNTRMTLDTYTHYQTETRLVETSRKIRAV